MLAVALATLALAPTPFVPPGQIRAFEDVRALWNALDQAPETRTDPAMASTSAASGARASKRSRADERAAKACDDADSEEKTPCPGARLVVSDDEDGELRGCAREGAGSREI